MWMQSRAQPCGAGSGEEFDSGAVSGGFVAGPDGALGAAGGSAGVEVGRGTLGSFIFFFGC
jgi:hypothetical protein